MKKIGLIALALTVGVSCAYAASIKVPWFIDNAPANSGLPPASGGSDGFPVTTTLISLSNTTATVLECSIAYYDPNGNFLGPDQNGSDNTFVIQPNATVQFRPVADDLNTVATPQGQEGPAGNIIPDRPREVNTGKNGSITITYQGEAKDMGGMVWYFTQGSTRATAISSAYSLIPLFGGV